MSNEKFYRAFEERYYAPREIIRELRKQYLPIIEPLSEIYKNGNTYDLGCGRGEWLELMQELNFNPYGIDLDDGMLEACYERNFSVSKGNGVEHIKTLEAESQVIITAFHVVEHIPFEDLQIFIVEALRALKPGGILIMETPNPENIKVGTENFYLDPTHIKPIPSKLLSFLPEFHGYIRTKVLRLQESKELANQECVNLLEVIEGVSPDYAVVSQKAANEEILKQFDKVFSKDFGLSLNSLSSKFENRLLKIEAKASEAATKASEAATKASEAEIRTNAALHNYHMVVNSNSWKLMKPFRLLGKIARLFVTGVKHWITFSPTSRPRRVLKQKLISLKHLIIANPKLKMRVVNTLNHFPKLKAKLKRVGQVDYHAQTNITQLDGPKQLSPRAKKIYNGLKKAIDLQKEDK